MDNANIILTAVLSVIALTGVLLRGVKWVLHSWAVEEGIIRPRRKGQPIANWPDPWHTLPDTLEGMHKEMRTHHPEE